MKTKHSYPPQRRGRWPTVQVAPPLTGAALGIALAGAALAFTDFQSPLRPPLTIFFLLTAPAAALAAGLRALDPLSRTAVALLGSAAVNALVAQLLLATGNWSVRTAIVLIAGLSGLCLPAGLTRARDPQADNRTAATASHRRLRSSNPKEWAP